MVKIIGRSNTKGRPNTRYPHGVAGWLQKNRKEEVDTFQTSYWPNSHHPLTLKMKRHPNAQCVKSLPTVKHLLNCDSFKNTCPKYYETSNLKDHYKKYQTKGHL